MKLSSQNKRVGLLLLLFLVIAFPIFLFIVYQNQQIRSHAAPAPIASVHINPAVIFTDIMGKETYLSALAYDQYGSPVWSGVSYQWGISSTNSVGTLYPNNNDKLATFKPSATNRGRADVWVKAYGPNGTSAVGSIPVYVGVSPTLTPAPTAVPTPTPTPILCLPADINKSGTVDGNDLGIFFTNALSTHPSPARADINGDGIVDLTDYSILVRDYGKSTGPCL